MEETMIMDKYTKAIMTVIAVALFMIALNPWIAPTKAYAELGRGDISQIQSDLHKISIGLCLNSKIC